MEARTILLTSLVFALWTSTTTGYFSCLDLVDGSYCQHCLQPVDCVVGSPIVYPLCEAGMACTVAFGASYCAPHTQTLCACAGTGPHCDAYDIEYVVHCDASGPFLVDQCPTSTSTCYNDECVVSPTCNPDAWTWLPDCTGAYYCDASGVIITEINCEDGEYLNSDYDCIPGPLAACDGSCTGRCPNPVDCSKYFVCDGTTVISSGSCPSNSSFDTASNTCKNTGYICTFLDGCDLEIGIGTPGTGGTTTRPGTSTPATTTSTITTTTAGSTFPPPAPETCNSSTVNSKVPFADCSQQYWICKEDINGQYTYYKFTCPGLLYFDTNTMNPYCVDKAAIATCQ